MSEIKDDFNLNEIYNLIDKKKLKEIFKLAKLDLNKSKYGYSHIGRMIENGLLLSDFSNANKNIVILFSIFHSITFINEEHDPDNGLRAASLLIEYKNFLNISKEEFEELEESLLIFSTKNKTSNKNIQICLDSFYLDSMINGIYPNKDKMLTTYAKNAGIITWAMKRAMNNYCPCWIEDLLN